MLKVFETLRGPLRVFALCQTFHIHNNNIHMTEVFILSRLLGVLPLMGITPFCVAFTVLHVCLCLRHSDILSASACHV